MKAAVFYQPEKLAVEEVELKEINETEMIVKIDYCAICGTDLRIYQSGSDKITGKRIIGHEIAGQIEKLGVKVEGYSVKDKVIIAPVIACGKCSYCKKGKSNLCDNSFVIGYHVDGGFAEYIHLNKEIIASGAVIKVNDDADLRKISIAEPLSCVINGQEYLDIKPADSVLVIGGGPIGVMNALLAKVKGAQVFLTDLNEDRLKLVSKMGINAFKTTSNLKEDFFRQTNLVGADFTIVACSAPSAQKDAVEVTNKGGKISFFAGLPTSVNENSLPTNMIHYKEISVFGANSSTIAQVEKAYKLIESGIIDADMIITHEVGLENIHDGLEMVRNGKAIKVVVKLI